jgi:hypothetical protein
LQSMYASIWENEVKQQVELEQDHQGEEISDPGFRIYHAKNHETGEHLKLPPYVYAPDGAFLESIERESGAVNKDDNQETFDMIDGLSLK